MPKIALGILVSIFALSCPYYNISLAQQISSSADINLAGIVKSRHGDWALRCDRDPLQPAAQCALIQNVTAKGLENVGLSVILLKNLLNEQELLRIVVPLGVLIPAGLSLRIDGEDMGKTGYIRCLQTGCVAEVIMDENILSGFIGGQQAIFIIYQTPEEGIGIPVSLKGFTEGRKALQGNSAGGS